MSKKRRRLWDPFTRPQPTWECLTHQAILVQAWKKAHNYLRTKSWFADVLELDLSAVDLKEYVDSLRRDILNGTASFSPSPLKLVPAPKSDRHPWEFSEGEWRPGPNTGKHLRPLAHLALRDQVLSTAILICLADCVETAQGDTELPVDIARKSGVSSYGNRLLVDWVKEEDQTTQGQFAWGNAALYRKYYVDYRAFLNRPTEVCHRQKPLMPGDFELGVASLDLQGFYDAIPVPKAIEALRRLTVNAGTKKDPRFWQAVKHCFAWEWDDSDIASKGLLRDGKLPSGVPQGLVAAGFVSNAYMVALDNALARSIKRSKPAVGEGWRIHDYCRYVDDIRLVVSGPAGVGGDRIATLCGEWMDKQLKKHRIDQKCNIRKTTYATHEEAESRTMRPTLMAAIQDKLSGPIDLRSLEDAGVALDGLLNTVHGAVEPRYSQKQEAPVATPLALEQIHAPLHTVRDDTVARFAAFRQLKSLRARRFLLAAEPSGLRGVALQRLDAEIEASARRMIWLWSRDPSLAIVLRHAMNLLPTPELVEPVIEALMQALGATKKRKREDPEQDFRRAVALYNAGELLKAGVIETGIDVSASELPEKADLDAYRDSLADFAQDILDSAQPPWYVARQAVLFLLSVGRTPLLVESLVDTVGEDYLLLNKVATGDVLLSDGHASKALPLIVVSDQLCDDRQGTITKLRKHFTLIPLEATFFEAERLALANSRIASELRAHLAAKRFSQDKYAAVISAFPGVEEHDMHSTRDLGTKALLAEVMGARDNPFFQETAALQLLNVLAQGLKVEAIAPGELQPQALLLRTKGAWSELENPWNEQSLKVQGVGERVPDPRYANPSWAKGERGKLYALGRVLRAAVLGEEDFTSSVFELRQFRDGYSGLKSSWYKRQHGLSTDLSTSERDGHSLSPWFASLVAPSQLARQPNGSRRRV